jgi:hypothetical protein
MLFCTSGIGYDEATGATKVRRGQRRSRSTPRSARRIRKKDELIEALHEQT